jgi:predicted transcriptional regulator
MQGMGQMKVYEFMGTKTEFVDHEDSVYDAVEKMVAQRIRWVVVKFPGEERNFGVITQKDIVFKVLSQNENPKKIKAFEIASRPVICIDKNMDFKDACKVMEKSNIARLFVCNHDRIIGVISMLDLMAAELAAIARGDYDS